MRKRIFAPPRTLRGATGILEPPLSCSPIVIPPRAMARSAILEGALAAARDLSPAGAAAIGLAAVILGWS
jgi:hypothetical protein